jgi:SAM-dependent methyltransferase
MITDKTFDKVVELVPCGTVLDIGSGNCCDTKKFLDVGYHVTSYDIKVPEIYDPKRHTHIQGLFKPTESTYDIIWASHVLEHIPNPHQFLLDVKSCCHDNTLIAITVPPLKHTIVGGHINLFNGGILMYRMILAGFNMRDCRILKYGYNISVLVTNTSIILPQLKHDNGDIETLSKYFPIGYDYQDFNGDITKLNWD